VVVHPGITVSQPTPNQVWTDGQSEDLVLPANTFTDALGLKMSFAAYEVSGPNVTSWLRFNPTTDELFGNVPTTASGTVGIAVIATDSAHMTAADVFYVSFVPVASHAPGASAVFVGSGSLFNPSQQASALLAVHV